MNWTPHNAFHCLASEPLAWLTIAACIGVVIWYLLITWLTWIPAMRGASTARSMFWMATIFIFCALAGYATLALAGWYPRAAYLLRVAALVGLNVACPIFLWSKANQDFKAIGREQRVGASIIAADLAQKTDAELAALVRQAVSHV